MSVLLSYTITGNNVGNELTLHVLATGDWTLQAISRSEQKKLFSVQNFVFSQVQQKKISHIVLEYQNNEGEEHGLGSLLLSFFCKIMEEAYKKNINVDTSSLSLEIRNLIDVDYNEPLTSFETRKNLFYYLGNYIYNKCMQIHASMDFIGDVACSLMKFMGGRAAISAKDVWQEIYHAGASSLPIVSLVSVLLGLILAFVSAIQLQVLGAEVYVSSLVTVSMVRVMSPVLTGIVIAGRIGASYAATIGSMQVNEEVDALKTFGIYPVDFLVLPRFLALSLMMPFLTVYADFMGILGGFVVIFLGWDVSFYSFLENVRTFTTMSQILIGLFHSFVFGIIISLCGCYQGMESGRDAEAVGKATTLAVVHSIIGIIVSTSVITIILSGFGL